MILLKTNIPGFRKDPKTGVIHNTNLESIKAAQEARQQRKIQRSLEQRIEDLEYRLRLLEDRAR